MSKGIALGLISAYMDCDLKAYLLLKGHRGEKCDYEATRVELREGVGSMAIQKIMDRHPAETLLNGVPLTRAMLVQGVPFVLGAEFTDEQFGINFDAIKKVDGASGLGSFHYVPVLFHEGRKICKSQRLLLEVLALLLARVQGLVPRTGMIFYGPDCAAATIRLAPGLEAAAELLSELKHLQDNESAPKLLLRNHLKTPHSPVSLWSRLYQSRAQASFTTHR